VTYGTIYILLTYIILSLKHAFRRVKRSIEFSYFPQRYNTTNKTNSHRMCTSSSSIRLKPQNIEID
jgi:hypothetical protein